MKPPLQAGDLRGLGRLATEATLGLTDLVEAMHRNIAGGSAEPGRTRGITGWVYRSIRGVTRLAGGGADAALARLAPLLLGAGGSSALREAVLAALNGVLGDHLQASGNPLAIPMQFRSQGQPLAPHGAIAAGALAPANKALTLASGKLLVLVHGLCMNDLQWRRNGHDHGAALAERLGATPVYLHYNSGLHISRNGQAFADALEQLLAQWPVPVTELTIIGHSMGGLLARSACQHGTLAKHRWRAVLTKLVTLGSPHHGAPLERGGNWLHLLLGMAPYAAPLARLGRLRSCGITDLRHGNLLDSDWQGRDRFAPAGDLRTPVPLPAGVACFTLAATTGKHRGDLGDRLLGDGLVPLASALGQHDDPARCLAFAPGASQVCHGINHMDLLDRAEVFEQLLTWLGPAAPCAAPAR